jgi:DNA-binding CsgD family transcriptional regulator
MSPRAHGSRTSKLARAIRTKKVLELTAGGASQEVIAQELGVSIPTVWSDLARIDAAANVTVESAEFRIQQRNQITAELYALKQAALADPLLDIMERSQLLLAIHDRLIRMHCLDDSSLLPGGGSGTGSVVVNLHVEFEDADDVRKQRDQLSLPPAPEEKA